MADNKFIPVCEPTYLGNEIKYACEAVKSGWISSAGDYIGQFEKAFASYCGTREAITTTSGTTALHLALRAVGLEEGDEVILPNFTMGAVPSAVLYCRAKPVFVDVERDTWNIDVSRIEEKITARTRVILPVHTYGHPVDMDPILALAEQHQLTVVEDAAEAHGAEYKGRLCGSLSDISCFSFFANKIITTGEGGMVATSQPELAKRCRYFKNLCFSLEGPRDYWHDNLGFNYRMTNVQAALGLAQLEKIDDFVQARRKNAKLYIERLADVPGLELPVEKDYAKNVYWMFGMLVNPEELGRTRDQLMTFLKERGVGTRFFFRPLHRQKMLEKFGIVDEGDYPVTEHLSEHGLYLPSSSSLSVEQIDYICEQIKEAKA